MRRKCIFSGCSCDQRFWICERQRETAARRRAGAAERLRLKRGESRPQICPTVAGGLLTDCSPPLPCGHSGRGERFFHSTSFPCHTERKCAADVWEKQRRAACTGGPRRSGKSIKSARDGACVSALESSIPAAHTTSPKTTCRAHCVRNTARS